MTGLKLSLALGVACFVTLGPAPSVAADPAPAVDIRSEDGKVLIAADQIRSYEWTTHTLTLAPKVRDELVKRLPKDRIVSGIPFVVAVGDKDVYKGRFTTVESSISFSTLVVVVDAQAVEPKLGADQLRIQLGYPTAAFFKGEDPRADRRIREALNAGGKLTEAESEHSKWLAKSLREMQTIKPGMTREELLKVFQEEEGGLSNRAQQRYAYRDCLYIKVDVRFEAVGAPGDKLTKSPKDKITRISTPFLAAGSASDKEPPPREQPKIDVIGAGETAMELVKTTKDTDAKWMAIRILGNLRYKRAIPLLLGSLSDPHDYVRANAARALGDMKVAAAAKPLTELLQKEKDGGVIQQASLALANLGCADALPALKGAAKHEDVQTRMWVLQAVGRLGDKRDVPFLAGYLDDPSQSVQAFAAQAIEQITGADFGFRKRSGPSSPDEGLRRAKAWWAEHKGEYGHR